MRHSVVLQGKDQHNLKKTKNMLLHPFTFYSSFVCIKEVEY